MKLSTLGYDDDSVLSSDKALYYLLNDAGAIIFKRIADKGNKIPDFFYARFPVPLEPANLDTFGDCEDIPGRVRVFKSKFSIPHPLEKGHISTLRVYSMDRTLPRYTPYNKYDTALKSKFSWDIINDYLLLFCPSNIKVLKGVEVEAVWGDIIQWQEKKYCEEADIIEVYSLDEIPFPIYRSPSYNLMAHDLVLQTLRLPINVEAEDRPNSAH